jgi:hypothetical protein
VSFRVEQKTPGKPVKVWLPPDTGSQQVREVVRYFKSEIQAHRFNELGISVPTFIPRVRQAGDYSAGSVLFYREARMKQANRQRKGSRIAEYKWGIEGSFEKDSGRMWVDANQATVLF